MALKHFLSTNDTHASEIAPLIEQHWSTANAFSKKKHLNIHMVRFILDERTDRLSFLTLSTPVTDIFLLLSLIDFGIMSNAESEPSY